MLFMTKLLLAVVAMTLALLYAMGENTMWLDYAVYSKLLHLTGLVLLGAAVYFGVLWILGIRIKDFMRRVAI